MSFLTRFWRISWACVLVVATGLVTGCRGTFSSEAKEVLAEVTDAFTPCSAPAGTPWTPNVSGTGSSNYDSGTELSETVLTFTGPLTGLGQAATTSREVVVNFTVAEDLGAAGSLTLTADVTGFPSSRQGWAYPLLVYLSDGQNEFVNLARDTNDTNSCASKGFFECVDGFCTTNAGCSVSWPSAFWDRDGWEQRQFPIFGYSSVNTFPTCNWEGGNTTSASNPACAFNSNFFSGGKLRTGNYTARYILLADSYASISGSNADLRVTITRKKDSSPGGAVDLNVILVGSKNIQASRTEQGKRNLDTLFTMVNDHFSQTGVGVKLGEIRVYEWGCQNGGETYANVDVNDLGTMFASGSAAVAGAQAPALNVFLVNEIIWSGGGTILGVSGAIGGPIKNGTQTSGLVFASFENLGSYNPGCSTSPCPSIAWEPGFADMGATISHEVGHYLGLNHPSESSGTYHDRVNDTPICTKKDGSSIKISSCLTDTNVFPSTGLRCSQGCLAYDSSQGIFCPDAVECQFNHLMWWSSKNFKDGAGDGNIISEHSGGVINYSPFIR